MIHGMIDLETLSTNPNATILTVGGVKFDPYNIVEPSQGMYFRVDVDSQTKMGRDVMEDTLTWWSSQPAEIRDEALGDNDRISLEDMIKTMFHELVHVKQTEEGDLSIDGKSWKGKLYKTDHMEVDYEHLPWEVEAFKLEEKMWEEFK